MSTYRKVKAALCLVLALAFSAFEIYAVGFAVLAPLVQRGIMLAFAAVLVFLLFPAGNWPERPDRPRALTAALGIELASRWEYRMRRRYAYPHQLGYELASIHEFPVACQRAADLMANWLFLQKGRGFTAKCEIRFRDPLPVGQRIAVSNH